MPVFRGRLNAALVRGGIALPCKKNEKPVWTVYLQSYVNHTFPLSKSKRVPIQKIRVPARLAKSPFDHKNLACVNPSLINKQRSKIPMPMIDTETNRRPVGDFPSSPSATLLLAPSGEHAGPDFRKKDT